MGGCLSSKEANKEGAGGGHKQSADKSADKEENKQFSIKLDFLTKVPLFQRLPNDEKPMLAMSCEQVEFAAGETIMNQGENGDEFFVIRTGEAKVLVTTDGEQKQVATLKTRDFFGEQALLREEPRAATIIAETNITAFRITRDMFRDRGLHNKLQFANRKAVGGAGRTLEVKPPTNKTQQEKDLITGSLKHNENLQTMVTLSDSQINAMIDVAWKESVSAGTEIIQEGDLSADYFYVVQSGAFEVLLADTSGPQGQSAEKALTKKDSKVVSDIPEGGSFGELALLYLVPRAATVRAKVDSSVWVFDRQNFKSILMKASSAKVEEFVGYLDKVKILDPLLRDEKLAMANALVEMHFAKGEIILQQGEPGNTFYILYEGTVAVLKDDEQQTTLAASKGRNMQFFGEKALQTNEKREATIQVISDNAKALALDRDSFNMIIRPLEDNLKKGANGQSQAGKPQAAEKPREKVLRRDLQKVGLLGCGGFGTVDLYEHKNTKETFAMKGLSKGYIVKTGMQESVKNERNILMMTSSPFIVKLYETYNGTQTLYFLMEPALGGELYSTYNRKGYHGSERHAKFYAAGTVCGFEHMHDRRIIYRDLKPENLLLSEVGHLKITDMGLAKFVIGKTYTTCGTPDYFAPELIQSAGHTNAVDWWTLGILIFELMSGHPPFESAYPMQIYSKVMKGIMKVPFPPKCQGAVGDLIKALLKNTPSERLTLRPGKVKNLKDHKWYNGFDWAAFEACTMDPPYKPIVKSKRDIANFAARKEDMPRTIEYHDDGSGWDKDFESR